MDDVVNIDDVVKLYAHRMFPEEAEGIIEAYEKNKSLFINGSPEEIFLDKKIFDHLPNKKRTTNRLSGGYYTPFKPPTYLPVTFLESPPPFCIPIPPNKPFSRM